MQSEDRFIFVLFTLVVIYLLALAAALDGYATLLKVMTAAGLVILVIATAVNIASLFKSQ